MADGTQPNCLVIWDDDIGITNLSCYSDGLMGYRTPNIDRLAEEGQVGLPGSDVGLSAEDEPPRAVPHPVVSKEA